MRGTRAANLSLMRGTGREVLVPWSFLAGCLETTLNRCVTTLLAEPSVPMRAADDHGRNRCGAPLAPNVATMHIAKWPHLHTIAEEASQVTRLSPPRNGQLVNCCGAEFVCEVLRRACRHSCLAWLRVRRCVW